MLYWRMPSYTMHHRHQIPGVKQLLLFDLPAEAKAVGTTNVSGITHPRTFLRLVVQPSNGQEPDQ